MTGKPANSQDMIQKMEAGIAAMESALNSCYFTVGGDRREQTPGVQKRADLLFNGIRDMKMALYYAQSGILCPECMGINNAGSRFCGTCGLEFDA